MDIKKLIGKTLLEAKNRCKDAKVPYRIVNVDGETQIVTADCSIQRVNLIVVDGIITKTKRG